MVEPIVSPERAVANIFNSAVAAPAIAAAWEVGLLDELRERQHVHVAEFAKQHDLDAGSMQGLVRALAIVDVVQSHQSIATASTLLEEAYRTKSLFHWLSLGSGGLFSRMQYALRNENRTSTFYSRDSAAIAYACRDINHQYFDPTFWAAMEGLDYKFHSVADLGCGSGERLMCILDRYPGTTGIGIDIAEPAIEVARAETFDRGLQDRLSFTVDDACKLQSLHDFSQTDLLTCFMMGHDFWPRKECIDTLHRLREAFPNVHRFLLGDAVRILPDSAGSRYSVAEDDVPIFTLGFEFGHAMMGDYLPTMEEWEDVFAEGGWRCVKRHLIESLSLSVLFELEHS